ncbi:MAG: OmpA family protein [bacterium]|nr:OmpA family protein [bacterium]
MKHYHDDEQERVSPPWMPLFISLMLVLLTLFIFLTTFAEKDKAKIETFKKHFRKTLLMPEPERRGIPSISDMGGPIEPIRAIINRMKSKGINKKLMDDFLTLNQIMDLEVMDGKRGVSVTVPEVAYFDAAKTDLTKKSKQFLDRISFLVVDLPYLVEIKGYAVTDVPPGFKDALEFSAKRASEVYNYFLAKDVPPVKLKVSGCGDAFEGTGVPQDKVEIIFKEAEL